MSYYHKKFIYRVFDSGTFVKVWADEVLSTPMFRNSINSGPGEMIVKLDRDFD